MNKPSSQTATSATQKFTSAVLVLAVAVLAGWAISLRKDLASAQGDLADARKASTSATTFAENKALRARVQELEARVAKAEEAPTAPAQKAAAPAAANPMASALTAMMNNPAMRATMADATKRALETRYAELLNRLQLSPEDRNRFIELLAERQNSSQDAAMKLMGGNPDQAERRALVDQMRESALGSEAKVRDFLGEANYAEYKSFNDQQTAKAQATILSAPFAQAGEPLTADQQSGLAAFSAEERKSFVYTQDLNADDADPTAILNDAALETYMRESQDLNDRIANRAAGVLTPSQLAVYQKYLANQLQVRKAALDLGRQLLLGTPAQKK